MQQYSGHFFYLSISVASALSPFIYGTVIYLFRGTSNSGFTALFLCSGIYNAFLSIGRAVGPTLGGVAFTLFPNPYELWFFTTLTGFISCVLFIVRFRKVDSLKYA